jgi:hypothetical protein
MAAVCDLVIMGSPVMQSWTAAVTGIHVGPTARCESSIMIRVSTMVDENLDLLVNKVITPPSLPFTWLLLQQVSLLK